MFQRFMVLLLAMATTLAVATVAAGPGNGRGLEKPRMFGKGNPFTISDLPPGRSRARLQSLRGLTRRRALEWLHRFDFPEKDLDSVVIDDEGAVLYVDPAPTGLPGEAEPVLPADGISAQQAAAAADQAFVLHSRLGAPHVVYLDFDGHTITGTAWNTAIDPFYAKPYDLDGSPSTFSATERSAIAEIWHRIAEDYSAFDVDVTTEEPASFGPHVGRVLITSKLDANGRAMPYNTGGGVAYVDVWGRSNYASDYSPALVYYDNLASGTTYIAEASTHEFGHNLGLAHDGTSKATYYNGHGNGYISWAPIMGTSYSKNVTQWSKGEYADANNPQDDIAIIASQLYLLGDDHGDALNTATSLAADSSGQILVSNPEIDPHNLYSENKGVIDSPADQDLFYLNAAAGKVDLTVNPAWDAFYRTTNRGSNLDILVRLLDASGATLATSDPALDTYASISADVPGGVYYLAVSGVGSSNYSDYGSVGQYFISGSIPSGTTNASPNASFNFTCAALTCRFTDTSNDTDGTIVSQSWAFGDGASSTAQNPDHSYATVGAYTVSLSVTDNGGATGTASETVTVTSVLPPPPTIGIDFNDYPLSSFAAQDRQGSAEVQDGGATLRLVGNTWKRIDFPYTVGPQTVIEFDFYSDIQGEIHGIGLDEDNLLTTSRIFKVHGTQRWGIQNFDDYAGSGWTHYRIPVGQYYSGNMAYLVFAMDHDSGAVGESRFRNVQVHEGSPSTQGPVITAPADITTEAAAVLTPVVLRTATTDDGSPVTNDAPAGGFALGTTTVIWSATNTAGNTSTTTQSVTVRDTTPPQLIPPTDITIVPGGDIGTASVSDIFPTTVTNDAPSVYPIGNTIVTWTATDTSGNAATATQTVTVINEQTPPPAIGIDFNDYPLSSFAAQDRQGTAEIQDGGATLRLVGNTWKRIDFPYTVGLQTVIEFDFYGGIQGEIHGIGLDEDNRLSSSRIFKVHGTQSWGIRDFDNYMGSGWTHYRIPVGQFYTGNMSYLVFAMDDDPLAAGEGAFRNVMVYDK